MLILIILYFCFDIVHWACGYDWGPEVISYHTEDGPPTWLGPPPPPLPEINYCHRQYWPADMNKEDYVCENRPGMCYCSPIKRGTHY